MNQGMVAFVDGKFTNASAHTSYLCTVKEHAPERTSLLSAPQKTAKPFRRWSTSPDPDPGGISHPEKQPHPYKQIPRLNHLGLPRPKIQFQNLNPLVVGPPIIY